MRTKVLLLDSKKKPEGLGRDNWRIEASMTLKDSGMDPIRNYTNYYNPDTSFEEFYSNTIFSLKNSNVVLVNLDEYDDCILLTLVYAKELGIPVVAFSKDKQIVKSKIMIHYCTKLFTDLKKCLEYIRLHYSL